MSQHANAVQSASATSTPSPTTSASSTGAVKGALRGQSFEAQEAMLTPVQRKTPDATPKTGPKPQSPPMTAKAGADPAKTTNAPKVAQVTAQQKLKLKQDLGKAKSIQEANLRIGNFLGGLVTQVDTSVDADLSVEVEVAGVILKAAYGIGLEHTKQGYELRGNALIGVGVGFKISIADAAATIEGAVNFKSKGDSVGECFDLVLLAIDRWLRERQLKYSSTAPGVLINALKFMGVGETVADALFGESYAAEVMKKMDPMKLGNGKDNEGADSIEFTEDLGLNVSASVGVGGLAKIDGDAGVGYREKTTLGKDAKTGEATTEEEKGLAGHMSLSGGALGVKGKTEAEYFITAWKELEGEASLVTSLTVPQVIAQAAAWSLTAFKAYADATFVKLNKIGGRMAQIGAVIERAIAAVQGDAIATLGAFTGLGSCELKFTLKLTLTKDALNGNLTIELINKIGADVDVGAGVAGVGLGGHIKTGTKLVDKPFTVAEKKKAQGTATGALKDGAGKGTGLAGAKKK